METSTKQEKQKKLENIFSRSSGFTIVELLIVVVVIAILAAITIVSFNGISKRAAESAVQADLKNASTQLGIKKVEGDTYPTPNLPDDIKASEGNSFEYTSDGTTFCLSVIPGSSSVSAYHVTSNGSITEGTCEGHGPNEADGSLMQTITSETCPTIRTRAVDARDSHTYWVQKLADGKCWMLTNLSYAGGGVNTYNDTRTLVNGTGSATTYLEGRYYVVPSTINITTEPVAPSTSADGTGQYGYLYNWCGAMGSQLSTGACTNATTPAPNTSISICPAGWRLPVGNGGEFTTLNTAINGGRTNTDEGLRDNWLVQRSGYWTGSFTNQGVHGAYWSSTQYSAPNASRMFFNSTNVYTANFTNKTGGYAVRCIAN